jgi:spermidine synthase
MLLRHRNLFFLLFALSGFSGLIYESIWTHYLKLFLGHAAYAQTLVLAIFMGGLALGSWICSKYSVWWKNLFLGYAVAEGAIGLFALIFHAAFVQIMDISYASVIPNLGSPLSITAYKWILSALMIMPQSILLGMTFPLMSAGVLRLFPDKPGRNVAMLYFTNSIGASIGVLVSGFMLIRMVGLPGTIEIAGAINIILAFAVWWLVRFGTSEVSPTVVAVAPPKENIRWYRLFLLASLVTGFASFIYEIGWIRMLSLVLGTSTHSFELMLSAFILGLAFGGLWIQRHIDQVESPVRYLAKVQVIMGLLALSTLLLYGNTFEIMQWLVKSLPKTDTGYTLFNLSSSGIAMAIMLPTTVCAGMTLPLITFILLRSGAGERSIGAVYAANTVGAIIGVFFAIHVGMPYLGLKGLITFGAGMDIALGVALIWSTAAGLINRRVLPTAMTAIGATAVAATFLFVQLDPFKMGSGVYRDGILESPDTDRLLYHKDGRTATVSCFLDNEGVISIRTNGKADAGIMTFPENEHTIDETTMILFAVVPMTLAPHMKTVASIGMGSGLTSHTLLSNPSIQQVDTVEIEREMVAAANYFRPRVELVYTDPRSKIYIDDAKTFFSTYNKKYDLIVSEPSNPWVSGVAGLFSSEFYRMIKTHLHDGGLFVQWVQLYEINVDLVASVLKAISENFPDYQVYASNNNDMLIVAKKDGLLPDPDYSVLRVPAIKSALERIKVDNSQDISIRKVGSKKFFAHLLESFPIRANSDYHPVLDQNAARARFLDNSARDFLNFHHIPIPAMEILDGTPLRRDVTNVTFTKYFYKAEATVTAMALRDYFVSGHVTTGQTNEDLMRKATFIKAACGGMLNTSQDERFKTIFSLSVAMAPYLNPSELNSFWSVLKSEKCVSLLSDGERQWLTLFKAVGNRDAFHMMEEAQTILANGNELSPIARKYLLISGMVGALAQGKRAEAYQLWTKYGLSLIAKDDPDLLFRMLAAESVGVAR